MDNVSKKRQWSSPEFIAEEVGNTIGGSSPNDIETTVISAVYNPVS